MDDILLDAVEVARLAGRELMARWRAAHLEISNKLGDADIVTEADKASERVVLDTLSRLHPGHDVLSEESGLRQGGGAEWRWVVDPLDGTTNFATGLRQWAVSIGVERDGAAQVGVVWAPALDELFTAVRGRGVWLNGQPMRCKRNGLLARAVVATGFPVDKDVNPDNNLAQVACVLPHIRGLRRLGSAALDLAYVGCGFLDAYWEMNLHPWDVAAGLLMVQEGGAQWTQYRQDRNVSVLAASDLIFPQLAPFFTED